MKLAEDLLLPIHQAIEAHERQAPPGPSSTLSAIHGIEIVLHQYVRFRLEQCFGAQDEAWWVEGVPLTIRQECAQRREADPDRREPYAYTNLIDLKSIIEKNWSTATSSTADAMRSVQTPPFSHLAAQLLSNSNGEQKASMLTELLASAGPVLPQLVGSSAAGGLLSQLLGSGCPVTAQDAEEISPEAVQELAQDSQGQDGSIIDRVNSMYSEHPTLVKTLGAGVLSVALARIGERMRA